MPFTAGIIIISDRAASGQREDACLPVFRAAFDGTPFVVADIAVVPDEPKQIDTVLRRFITREINLVLTAGGTGCAARDVTPEVTTAIVERPTPGIDEAIRVYSRDKSPYAMFSRARSGIAGTSLIINLPGSPKAVAEILEFLVPLVPHALKLISGHITDCREDLIE